MVKRYSSVDDNGVVESLLRGGVGVIPTDTLYGVVCLATDQKATARLYGLKQRVSKPGTLIAASIDQLVNLGIKRRYLKAVEQFWPGAVSVVIPMSDSSTHFLRQGLPSMPVRIPSDNKLAEFLAKTGPLLTTSANPAGQPPAETIQTAEAYFKNKVDFYVDGGDLHSRLPSTIIRVVDDAVEVLRKGAVTIDEQTGKVNHDI